MALILSKAAPNGIVGSYFRVVGYNVDLDLAVSYVTVSQYVDQQMRDSGMGLLNMTTYCWQGNDFPFSSDATEQNRPLDIAYKKLKTLDEFSGAVDG